MLTITIKAREVWDSDSETFKALDRDWTIQLEHSLISISKWEAIHKIPYLSQDPEHKKTKEQIVDYIRCMTITPNVDPNAYDFLDKENLDAIQAYINDPHTATWFNKDNIKKRHGAQVKKAETLTTELIYYYMIINDIPWEAQKWHINRLITLIQVCAEKNSESPKVPKKDLIKRNSDLNKARRMALGSKG